MRGACSPCELARLRGLGRAGLWALTRAADDFSEGGSSLASSTVPRSVDDIEGGALAKETFFSRREVRWDLGAEVNEPDDALRRVFSRTCSLASWTEGQLLSGQKCMVIYGNGVRCFPLQSGRSATVHSVIQRYTCTRRTPSRVQICCSEQAWQVR